LDLEIERQAGVFTSADTKKAFAALVEKRSARFAS